MGLKSTLQVCENNIKPYGIVEGFRSIMIMDVYNGCGVISENYQLFNLPIMLQLACVNLKRVLW